MEPVAVNPVTCVPVYLPAGNVVRADVGFTAATSGACELDFGPAQGGGRGGNNGPRAPDVNDLADIASDHAIALAQDPELSIAPGEIGLTGLPTYFWLANRPHGVAASAGVPGLTVTAEARPVQYVWDFGDGEDLVTESSGRPWNRGRKGNIGHTYETKGHYTVEVEVVWEARWRVGTGAWRSLGFFSNRDSARYPVRQVVSVLVDSRR